MKLQDMTDEQLYYQTIALRMVEIGCEQPLTYVAKDGTRVSIPVETLRELLKLDTPVIDLIRWIGNNPTKVLEMQRKQKLANILEF